MNAIPGHPLATFMMAATEDGVVIPNPATVGTLHDADVILGRDVATHQEHVIFGRETLRQVAQAEDEPEGYNILCIEIDCSPGATDLERLIALVQFVRGRHDFIRFDLDDV